jgi:hypothetical protein
MTRKRSVFYALYLLMLVSVCFLLAMEGTEAATYNFYFNNTEQGANSSASPSVVVQDGKVVSPTSTSTDTSTSTETSTLPMSEPPAETPGGSIVQDVPALERTFPDAKWKFSLGTAKGAYRHKSERFLTGLETAESFQAMGSLTHYFTREIGGSFHVGRFMGPEIEFNPFGVRTGWGKAQFGLTAALFKDMKGFYADNYPFWMNSRLVRTQRLKKPLNFYVGAQVGLNVIRDVAVNLAFRVAPLERHDRLASSLQWSASYLF